MRHHAGRMALRCLPHQSGHELLYRSTLVMEVIVKHNGEEEDHF